MHVCFVKASSPPILRKWASRNFDKKLAISSLFRVTYLQSWIESDMTDLQVQLEVERFQFLLFLFLGLLLDFAVNSVLSLASLERNERRPCCQGAPSNAVARQIIRWCQHDEAQGILGLWGSYHSVGVNWSVSTSAIFSIDFFNPSDRLKSFSLWNIRDCVIVLLRDLSSD